MDNLEVLDKIMKRLPTQWYSSRQCEIDYILLTLQREVSIEHLCSFANVKTRQCTNMACEVVKPAIEKKSVVKVRAANSNLNSVVFSELEKNNRIRVH